jgi:hypothetical protein
LTPTPFAPTFAATKPQKAKNENPMKNLTLICTLVLASLTTLSAQLSFKPGDIELAAGVGVISTYAKDGATTIAPPVNLRMDVRLSPNFSLGAYAAYASFERNGRILPTGAVQDISNESFQAGLRATAHGQVGEKFNIYGGGMLGYDMATVEESIDGQPKSKGDEPSFIRPEANNNALIYSAFIGATYYPKSNLGFFGEVGYGNSLLNVGVSFRL